MSDEDTIKRLRERVEMLTRANEILIAQRDELRRIFDGPPQMAYLDPTPGGMFGQHTRVRVMPAASSRTEHDDGPGF